MKVICAGFAKTGTKSLAKALRILGYNVYDIEEHVTFHRQEWRDSFETDRLPNFKEMYQGVDAITDIPPVFWFEEIAAAFPEAKVILTVRDSEEVWLKSWKGILQLRHQFSAEIVLWLNGMGHFLDTIHAAIFGSCNPEATALFRKKYRQHNERVQAVIPAERLLVFNVKQGWKPLCEFLECDVPPDKFPRENVAHAHTKQHIANTVAKFKSTIAYAFVFGIMILAAVLLVNFRAG